MFAKTLFCTMLFSLTFVSGSAIRIKHGEFQGSSLSEKFCFEFYELENGSLVKPFKKRY